MQSYDVLVIGGGQAGLGMGYRLRGTGLSFAVVEAAAETGISWRDRWDSLELFTPRPFAQLPGLALPPDRPYFPGKDDIAGYLRRYRQHWNLPVHHNQRVRSLSTTDGTFDAVTDNARYRARQVVLATGPFHTPHVPACAAELDEHVWQGHSHDYRRPSDVPDGDVLVVGGGNSAAQITEELAATHRVTIASNGTIAFGPRTILGISLFWYLHLTGALRARTDSRLTRYVRPYADTVLGGSLRTLIKRGTVTHVPHAVSATDGDRVVFADGSRRGFDAVLWCTGYRSRYDWLDVDGALDDTGEPAHTAGISPVRGLYWLGLPWQRRLNSALLNGVAADSAFIATRVQQVHRACAGTRP